jgi:hypothetical protein
MIIFSHLLPGGEEAAPPLPVLAEAVLAVLVLIST